ncbi:MAG: ABC transporter ATP-binding protein [Bacteroidota bacterium]
MSELPILKATDIHKSYGDIEVLKGIDIEVSKAEVISVVGASGAGKSTLLHILGSLDKPDRGEIVIGNKKINRLSRNKLASFRNNVVGFVFQFHNLLPEFTALENVCIPGLIGNRNPSDVEAKAMELMNLLGLSDRINHKPSMMSGGEQQRAAVARALVNSPDIIFADEPSGNLDSHNAEELHQLFFNLREKLETSFVIVTHNPSLAGMADRKLTIEDGKII